MSYIVSIDPGPSGWRRLVVSDRRGVFAGYIQCLPEHAEELIRLLTAPHTTDPAASYDAAALMAGTEPAPQEE